MSVKIVNTNLKISDTLLNKHTTVRTEITNHLKYQLTNSDMHVNCCIFLLGYTTIPHPHFWLLHYMAVMSCPSNKRTCMASVHTCSMKLKVMGSLSGKGVIISLVHTGQLVHRQRQTQPCACEHTCRHTQSMVISWANFLSLHKKS
jgi:hypothetical protein